MAGKITLLVNGVEYEGWEEVTVDRSVSDMSGSFSLQVSEKWATGQGPGIAAPFWQPWKINPGDACALFYDGILAITGVVDNRQPSYDAQSHGVQISGRSKTRDLVDSSAKLGKTGEAKKLKLDGLAKKLTEKFDVKVEIAGDMGEEFASPRVMQGETVQQMIERYARQRGVLPTDTVKGNLKLLQVLPGAPVASLIEGKNILAARSNISADKKHSKYTAKGQEPGTDKKHGTAVSDTNASVQDPSVKRHRPLIIMDEGAMPKGTAKERANWEAAQRGGESIDASITVQGWTRGLAGLWQPGDLVFVNSPMLGLNRVLAVQSVSLRQAVSEGTKTELRVVPIEALNPKAGSKSGGKTPPGSNATAWVDTKPKVSAA